MVEDDLSDTAELELMDTDVLEQLPDAAAKKSDSSDGASTGGDAPPDDAGETESKPGFDPYNHS